MRMIHSSEYLVCFFHVIVLDTCQTWIHGLPTLVCATEVTGFPTRVHAVEVTGLNLNPIQYKSIDKKKA